jgi:hypothetical protein
MLDEWLDRRPLKNINCGWDFYALKESKRGVCTTFLVHYPYRNRLDTNPHSIFLPTSTLKMEDACTSEMSGTSTTHAA